MERRTAYFDKAQVAAAREAGRVKVPSRVWTYYIGKSSHGVTGYAYFDTHIVKTLSETVMVVLKPDGAVRFVEILAFSEPDEYRARPNWLAQFEAKTLKGRPRIRRGIKNMSGASLTAQALADAVRRVLAVHSIIHKEKGTSESE